MKHIPQAIQTIALALAAIVLAAWAPQSWTESRSQFASVLVGQTHAQMDFNLDDEGDAPPDEGGEGDEGDDGGSMTFGEDGDVVEEEGGAADFGEDEGMEDDGGGGGDIIGELAAEEDTGPEQRENVERPTETKETIYAVQQIYALRLKRAELAPSAAFTINDPYVSHPALSIAFNYWWTNVLALGVSFLWYQWGRIENRESDLNFFVRRSTRLAIPITEWQLGAYLNFTYVPFYGKFAVFNEFIFQWDAYIVGGVGLMRTRPVPVVDPEVREFSFGNRVAFNLGLGIRVFLSRWLGIFLEFRDYAYLEQFENLTVSVTARQNPDTWVADSPTFTNNITAQIGFTMFLPFTFEYNQPK